MGSQLKWLYIQQPRRQRCDNRRWWWPLRHTKKRTSDFFLCFYCCALAGRIKRVANVEKSEINVENIFSAALKIFLQSRQVRWSNRSRWKTDNFPSELVSFRKATSGKRMWVCGKRSGDKRCIQLLQLVLIIIFENRCEREQRANWIILWSYMAWLYSTALLSAVSCLIDLRSLPRHWFACRFFVLHHSFKNFLIIIILNTSVLLLTFTLFMGRFFHTFFLRYVSDKICKAHHVHNFSFFCWNSTFNYAIFVLFTAEFFPRRPKKEVVEKTKKCVCRRCDFSLLLLSVLILWMFDSFFYNSHFT